MIKKNVIHYQNLKLYLDLALKISKIHLVLQFNQSSWLKQYIDFNTHKRTNAKNAFEKYFFLLTSSWKNYGNLRKRCCVKLINNKNNLIKYTARPLFISSTTV